MFINLDVLLNLIEYLFSVFVTIGIILFISVIPLIIFLNICKKIDQMQDKSRDRNNKRY